MLYLKTHQSDGLNRVHSCNGNVCVFEFLFSFFNDAFAFSLQHVTTVAANLRAVFLSDHKAEPAPHSWFQ